MTSEPIEKKSIKKCKVFQQTLLSVTKTLLYEFFKDCSLCILLSGLYFVHLANTKKIFSFVFVAPSCFRIFFCKKSFPFFLEHAAVIQLAWKKLRREMLSEDKEDNILHQSFSFGSIEVKKWRVFNTSVLNYKLSLNKDAINDLCFRFCDHKVIIMSSCFLWISIIFWEIHFTETEENPSTLQLHVAGVKAVRIFLQGAPALTESAIGSRNPKTQLTLSIFSTCHSILNEIELSCALSDIQLVRTWKKTLNRILIRQKPYLETILRQLK